MRIKCKLAFTLIELLVVIAIIAILAATLIPVVTSALDDARVAQMRDTGVGLYKSIFAAEVDDPVFGGNNVSFPSNKDTVKGADGWVSSTEYFRYLIASNVVEADFKIFSGPGTAAYSGTDTTRFSEEHNAWNVTLDVASQITSTPFLFSRNLELEGDKLPDGDIKANLKNSINKDGGKGKRDLRFHNKAVVSINKGGAGFIIKKTALDGPDTVKNFNPTSNQLDVATPLEGGG
ncbi:MAG: prepilin-type N-terminal cleavage/methylation domain-containing protein [Kiritimatiellia bacterium]|jgi:prepilin-type N-terminal cleavage/methylation domain-containing protein